MYKYFMTCNIYNNMLCEEIEVMAETLKEAMQKTKETVFHEFGAGENDFNVTRVRCEEVDLGLLLHQSIKAYKGYNNVKKYIDLGADVNYRFRPNEFDFRPLHMAAYSGDMQKIGLLVEAGCEMNPLDFDGYTPLDHAIRRHNRPNVIDYLVAHGAKRSTELQRTVEETIKGANLRVQTVNSIKNNEFDYLIE